MWMDKALLGSNSVNALECIQQYKYSVYCSMLGNKQCDNEFTVVSAATIAMQ
jgi:hypothetical protein